ncbi:beta-phosphoglucomutase family hydrolase [Streptomyces sp. NPDC057428]|uniref:beta-phosphoglucomutase family hydrolase n=1 Tax=Streptomyces sp. NPDC057428 TaxID=3346129 RepID=UPI00367FEF6B
MEQLGLPAHIQACLFDMDGVITKTAVVHAAAWKQAFDEFLRRRYGASFTAFDSEHDYNEYVDGKPRADGVRSFLASRDITLPEGSPEDSGDQETVRGLGNRKNALLLERIRTSGVEAYPSTLRYVRAVRQRGLRTGVVSSSVNCRAILQSVQAEDLFDVRVDGLVAAERGLAGKPRPDTFLAAAEELGVKASVSAVFEDALAGMEAGRSGHFGYVVGLDRVGQADALRAHGADIVVPDLADMGDQA